MDWLGDEGVVCDSLPHSPMQMLMIDWIGSEEGRCFYHLADYPDLVDDLYRARLAVASRSTRSPPSRRRRSSSGATTSTASLSRRRLFERYFMPEYEKQAAATSRRGQAALRAHGRPARRPEGPDRPERRRHRRGVPPVPDERHATGEALAAWPEEDDLGWVPGGIYALGPEATREYTEDLCGVRRPTDGSPSRCRPRTSCRTRTCSP